MELATAIRLIEKGVEKHKVQSWADLGAGSGLFTTALSDLLMKGSSITAIDKTPSKIKVADGIQLQIKTSDFLDLDFEECDGIVMANSLHYVKDQPGFLKKLSNKTSRLVLVEYDTDKGNQWVPYPISFSKLNSIIKADKIGAEASAYHTEGIYAALVLF